VIEVDAAGKDPEELSLVAIEAGAEDISVDGDSIEVTTGPNEGAGQRQELTSELATLDRQLRELSQQWDDVEQSISEKVRRRRELLARQEETNEDHSDELQRLQSEVYALRDRLDQLRDSRLDFSALYRILKEAKA
jgi:predicted RNase H-like nuclease (RuvC/YqgF family)